MLQSGTTTRIHDKYQLSTDIECLNNIAINHTEHTSADKIPAGAISEVMKHSVAVILKHLSMNVEARVAKLCNFLSKKFHPIHRIAENNRLVYLKLKQR